MHHLRTLLFLGLLAGAAQAQSGLFIITSDFSTGSSAWLPAGAATAQVNVIGLHSDAVGRYQDGRLYVINRLGQDNILVLDPDAPGTVLAQFSVGNGTNPHDIEVVAEDRAYVTRYDAASMLVVDPRDGTELGSVDLSAFADGDGLPEMSQIARVGDRLYVTCQRLDRDNGFAPQEAVVVVVDVATGAVVDDIALSTANPNSLVVVGDRLVVAGSGAFGARDGGIDIVDTRTATSLGLVVDETVLGGDLSVLALHRADAGFAVVLDENFANLVVPVDLATGTVGTPLEGLSGGFIPSLAVDGDRLWVADQGSFTEPDAAGLKAFDVTTGQRLGQTVDTGLPPADIVVLGPTAITAVVETGQGAVPEDSALQPAFPNPFNATVRVPFTVAGDGAVRLTVHDALGRRLRTLTAGVLTTGRYQATWDGRDDAGRIVGSGLYVVRLQTAALSQAIKVTLLK